LSLGPSSPFTRVPRQHSLPNLRYLVTPHTITTATSPSSEACGLPPLLFPSHHPTLPDSLTMPGALTSPDEDSASIRPHASPRSSRSNSQQGSFSFGISSEVSRPHTDSSEEQSPTRGRTLVRKPAHRTTNRRATTIHQERRRTIEWDSILTQERLMSRDLTAEPQGIFDSILEPLPPGVERFRSSLSEELYKSATWGSSIDLSRFGGHRDTFALLGLHHLQPRRVSLPAIFFERLLLYIDFESYLAIRLSCRCWSEAITRICPIVSPPG